MLRIYTTYIYIYFDLFKILTIAKIILLRISDKNPSTKCCPSVAYIVAATTETFSRTPDSCSALYNSLGQSYNNQRNALGNETPLTEGIMKAKDSVCSFACTKNEMKKVYINLHNLRKVHLHILCICERGTNMAKRAGEQRTENSADLLQLRLSTSTYIEF